MRYARVYYSDIINVAYSIWFLHTEVHDVHIFLSVRSCWLRVDDPPTASKSQSCSKQAAFHLHVSSQCKLQPLFGCSALAQCEFHLLQAHRLHRVRTPSGNANPRTEYVVVDRFSMNLSSLAKLVSLYSASCVAYVASPWLLFLNQPINQ